MSTVNQIKGNTSVEETLEQIYLKASAMELSPDAHGEVNKLIVSTFQAGVDWALPDDPLEGFSNLTEAIKAGEPIDWERLDGLKAQCVQPGSGSLSGKLVRDDCWLANSGSGWEVHGMSADYLTVTAWYGEDGWSLWIEGEIPLVRKTADQLDVGTYFRGEIPCYVECEAYVGGEEFGIGKRVHRAPSMIDSTVPASEWVVLEEYGTFQKPEDE